jgi:hypothetical protein
MEWFVFLHPSDDMKKLIYCTCFMMLINVSCWGQSYPFEPSRLKRLVKSDSAEYFLNGSHLNINTSFLSEDDVRIDSVRRDGPGFISRPTRLLFLHDRSSTLFGVRIRWR